MLICWCEKTTGNGVKNDGHRRRKPWATKFIRMGNEIYPNGQRNSSEWAMKFIRMAAAFLRGAGVWIRLRLFG